MVRKPGILLVTSLVAGVLGARQEAPRSPRLFNPNDADQLEQPSRDGWQKPADVVMALKLEPGDVVADIGTGSGYFVPYLSRAVGPSGRVYAVDIQPEMLAFVERKIGEFQLTNVITVLSQEADTRLEPQSVDLALMVDVYHELASPSALLSNIRSVLKPEGRFAIIDFKNQKEAAKVGPPLSHRVPEDRAVAEVQETGFDLAERLTLLPYQYFLVFSGARDASTSTRSPGSPPQ